MPFQAFTSTASSETLSVDVSTSAIIRRHLIQGVVATTTCCRSAVAWTLRPRNNAEFVKQTVQRVVAEAPGSPRNQADLPDEEQVLLQIWTAACMYGLDAELAKAGGRDEWEETLLEGLRDLRATRWEDGFQWLGDTLLSNFGVNPTWDGREHTSKRLIDAADRLLEKLGDPYAQYYPPEEWTEMTEVAEGGDVAGIGVAFAQDTTRGRGGSPEVVAVVPGSSASDAGVEVGDRLVEVDGQSMRVPADAARWIPGRPGTWANVRFQRRASVKGAAMTDYSLTLQRQPMRVQPVEFRIPFTGVGYIRIVSFNGPDVVKPLRGALHDAVRQQLRYLILDLRDNRGGRLSDAQRATTELQQQLAQKNIEAAAVLVNSKSASASELMAVELRRSKVPVVFCGDEAAQRTFGKAEEQEAIELSDGGALPDRKSVV